MPFRVDLVDWQCATAAFKASVDAQGMVPLTTVAKDTNHSPELLMNLNRRNQERTEKNFSAASCSKSKSGFFLPGHLRKILKPLPPGAS